MLAIWPAQTLRAKGTKYIEIKIPKVFSFIRNADETLETLISIRRALGLRSLTEIYFDHSQCEYMDLCASIVRDVIVLRAKTQARLEHRKLTISGNWSNVISVNVMLVSSGILKHLKHPISELLPQEIKARLRLCPLKIGRPGPLELSSDSELEASKLAAFFDECLRTEHYRLKGEWKLNLINLITEVLDNAEQHAGEKPHWYTIGYYNHSETQDEGGECHIVLFNFGMSIFESLNGNDTSEELKHQIRELADFHRSRGFFAFTKKIVNANIAVVFPIWQEETLWTLYSLQEGVSRFRNLPGGEDRGNGTVKMIDFFTELASKHPEMALVSGSTHILFDGTYRIHPIKVEDGEERKVIAFNEANDLKQHPDFKYVRSTPNYFPGTLVTLRFRVRKNDLDRIKERLDEHGDN